MTAPSNGAGAGSAKDGQWLGLLARRLPVDASAPGQVEVLAHDSASLVQVRPLLRLLAVTGWDVSLSYWQGDDPDWRGPDGRTATLVRPGPTAQHRSAGLRGLRGLVGRRPLIDHRQVPSETLARWGAGAVVVPLDGATTQLVTALVAEGVDLTMGRADELAAAALAQLAARGAVRASDVKAARVAIGLLESASMPSALWTAVGAALLGGSHFETLRLLCERAHALGVSPAAGTEALGVVATLSQGQSWRAEWTDVVRGTLTAADTALGRGDIDRAVVLAALAQRVVFHREIHTSSATSPLISAPDPHLAPLAGSAVMTALRGAPTRRPGARTADGGEGRPVAVILPGAYPSFAGAVAAVLEPDWDIRVVALGDSEARFRNTEVDAPTLRELWDLNAGTVTAGTPHLLADAMAGAGLVFVDWADKGAVLASRLAPSDARLVLRVNGVDTLSSWIHLVNWPRVDSVVFVSEHLRRTALAMLGDRLAGIEQVVVPHAVDLTRFGEDKPARAAKVLGMVGWAQRVKDPMFALEVLALLRSDDSAWRLRLIGPDFSATGTRSELAYAEAFRNRLMRPDVLGSVDFAGAVSRDQVPVEVAEVGFALSTSVRESWHVGAMEMLAGGAVPVIRDWPLYSGVHGAGDLFPPDSLVATPEEAAARIRSFADDQVRAAAGAAARDFVAHRYSSATVQGLLRRTLAGPLEDMTSAAAVSES